MSFRRGLFGVEMVAATLLVLLFVASATTAACDVSSSLPGTSLGTFAVTADVSGNTCGTSLGAEDPWTFDLQLARDGSTLYWQGEEATTLDGVLDASSSTTIVQTETSYLGDSGFEQCLLTRTQTIGVTLGPGEEVTTVSGTVKVDFAVDDVGACVDQLSANGGSFQTLPCGVAYSFTGTKSE